MDNRLLEIGAELAKGLVYTIRWCCRSVLDHPFFVVFLCFLLFLYRSFPLIFSLLVSASPVLVCTAVLLGILLSYGQPNIPEIEIDDRKTDVIVLKRAGALGYDVVEKNERCCGEGFREERKDGLVLGKLEDVGQLIEERSREFQLSDGETGEGSRDLDELGNEKNFEWNEEGVRVGGVLENHFSSITEGDEENDGSDDRESGAESFGSEKVNVDSLDSPPRSPWTRVDEVEVEGEGDSGSDRAESSSPDASMAEIMPMLDELHPLLDEEAPQPVRVSSDSSDVASESSSISSHESGDESESREGLAISDNDGEDARKDEEEEQVKSAITWTEEDQKNLMELRSSEIERNQRLENLIMRRAGRSRTLENGIENNDDDSDAANDDNEDGEDEEDGQEDKEEQIDSPIAWTEEDQKKLMELQSSELERNQRLENIIMRRARGRELDNEIEVHSNADVANGDNDDGEDEEDGQEDKEEQTESPIAWTEEDQKNVMDLGWSEIERNQRLENLILRRRARKNMNILPERNLAGLESYDLSFNVAPISTRRQNPFDLPDDSHDSGLPPIPGSAPSVLLPRRNPFDIPYDSSEEKPDLLGDDEFQEEFFSTAQPREPIFRRYESVNVRPSRFAYQGQEEQEVNMRPIFVPEHTFSEEPSNSQFQRQSSELSDSKVSSVPETESISSFEDLGNRTLPEEDDSLEVVANSESVEVIEEHHHQELEPISIVECVAEHVRHGSDSSDEEDSIELGQVEKRVAEVSEVHVQSQDVVEDYHQHGRLEDRATEYQSLSNTIEQRYCSDSSSSSLEEISERVFTRTRGEGLLLPEELRRGFAKEPGISALTTTSTLVTETPYRTPVYDLSPSSSSSTDVHPMPDPGFPPVLIKRTVTSVEKESGGISWGIETNIPCRVERLAESSNADLLDESRPIDIVNTRVHNNFGSCDKAMDEPILKHLDEVQTSNVPVQLSKDVPATEKSNVPHEILGLDHDIPLSINASLSPHTFETSGSHHNVQTVVEEVNEIKEIDGLLSELDNIGDFGNNQWGSSSSEFEKRQDSVGESLSMSHQAEASTILAVDTYSVELNKIDGTTRPRSLSEGIQVEKNVEFVSEMQTSEINTAENTNGPELELNERGGQGSPGRESSLVEQHTEDVDTVPKKAQLASSGTEVLVGDITVSCQGQDNEDTGSRTPELEPKETEKPVVKETITEHSTAHMIPSVQLNDSSSEEKLKLHDSVNYTLKVVESGDSQGNSLDSHGASRAPLENTASPQPGNIEKQLLLSLDDSSVEIKGEKVGSSSLDVSSVKEKIITSTSEKPPKEVEAPKDKHSTSSPKGKGKLSKSPSSSSSSSSSSSDSDNE